jgi:hypothetical protein
LKNLPLPLFSKEGYITSLWQREVRRDFIINVFILMTLLVTPISFPFPSVIGGDKGNEFYKNKNIAILPTSNINLLH